MTKQNHKSAFTIVETTLAMSFIGVLLVVVAYIIIQMSSIYQKTLSVKSVNTGGREVVDDLTRHIAASSLVSTTVLCGDNLTEEARNQCEDDGAFKYIYQQYYSDGTNIYNRAANATSVPTFGVFCTGRYTYIWNSGYVLNGKDKTIKDYRATIKYSDGGTEITSNDFRLIRIKDPLNDLCSNNFNGKTYTLNSDTFQQTYELSSRPDELLRDSDTELAIYDFRVFKPAQHKLTQHAYYAGTFILASLQGEIDIMAKNDYCKAPPEGYISEFTYCAINKFNFAAQAIGELDV